MPSIEPATIANPPRGPITRWDAVLTVSGIDSFSPSAGIPMATSATASAGIRFRLRGLD